MQWVQKVVRGLLLVPIMIAIQCNPSAKIKRKIDKIVSASSPEYVVGYIVSKYKLKSLENDTVIHVRDSIVKDTLLVIKTEEYPVYKHDTFYIGQDRLKIRIIRKNDTIRVSGSCISDTVYRYKTVYVEKPVEIQKESWFDRVNSYIVVFIILGLIILYAVNKFFKDNF